MTLEEYIKGRREELEQDIKNSNGGIVDRASDGGRKLEIDILDVYVGHGKVTGDVKIIPFTVGILIGLVIFEAIKSLIS